VFTGIIEELGQVVELAIADGAARLKVTAPLAASDAAHGDSISVSGVCLTVVDQGADWFVADVMAETLRMSTIGALAPGDRVNLERAAAVGGRLGGHLVQGHVDGTATLLSREEGSAWRVLRFTLPADLAPLVANKGSITVSGVSLTVSAVSPALDDAQWFEVSLIPETLSATTLGTLEVGDTVNLETDIVARHVERLLSFRGAEATNAAKERTQP
jgi:riboflavin synthase